MDFIPALPGWTPPVKTDEEIAQGDASDLVFQVCNPAVPEPPTSTPVVVPAVNVIPPPPAGDPNFVPDKTCVPSEDCTTACQSLESGRLFDTCTAFVNLALYHEQCLFDCCMGDNDVTIAESTVIAAATECDKTCKANPQNKCRTDPNCPDLCNSAGTCTNGVCNCQPGFAPPTCIETKCAQDEHVVSNQCKPCDAGYYNYAGQSAAGQNTACSLVTCKCTNGKGATGTACPNHDDFKCVDCDANYALSGDECQPIKCSATVNYASAKVVALTAQELDYCNDATKPDCSLTCVGGHHGSPTLSCTASGAWSIAGCQEITCSDLAIPHVNDAKPFDHTVCDNANELACSLECRKGTSGSPTMECNASGSWVATGQCLPVLCGPNEKVVSNECVPCDPGTEYPLGVGVDASGPDLSLCTPIYCGAQQKVVGNTCVPCEPGTTNAAGGNASGPNTSCTAITCGVNEYVQNHACVACDKGTWASGGGNAALADTTCLTNTCTCANGTGASSLDCPKNGDEWCSDCNKGYTFDGTGTQCEPVTCNPEDIDFDVASLAEMTAAELEGCDQATEGSCTAQCLSGTTGTPSIKCLDTSYWSIQGCIDITCPSVPSGWWLGAEDMDLAACDNANEPACAVLCKPGYQGTPEVECTGTGTWQLSGDCVEVKCDANQYVESNTCKQCAPGTSSNAGQSAASGDSVCFPIICDNNEKVVGNTCVSCEPGTTSKFGADASQGDTSCDPVLCSVNMFVSSNTCVPCQGSSTNEAGDDASGGDTLCDAPFVAPPPVQSSSSGCDLTNPPENGSKGDCTADAAPGTQCTPDCNTGYLLTRPAACAADGQSVTDGVCTAWTSQYGDCNTYTVTGGNHDYCAEDSQNPSAAPKFLTTRDVFACEACPTACAGNSNCPQVSAPAATTTTTSTTTAATPTSTTPAPPPPTSGTCDLSQPFEVGKENGTVGDCTNQLPAGQTCTPVCYVGYLLTQQGACGANGRLSLIHI